VGVRDSPTRIQTRTYYYIYPCIYNCVKKRFLSSGCVGGSVDTQESLNPLRQSLLILSQFTSIYDFLVRLNAVFLVSQQLISRRHFVQCHFCPLMSIIDSNGGRIAHAKRVVKIVINKVWLMKRNLALPD
jgi:hypothetical protein